MNGILNSAGISKRFGSRSVLKAVGLQLADGECVTLQGENGSGKSTLLRILSGTLKPDHYERIELRGADAYNTMQYRSLIHCIHHAPMFYSDLSAAENLRFFLDIYGKNPTPTERSAALDRVGLLRRQNDPVRTFSRGMQQRLAICRALLIDPLLYLMDEPYTGLDEKSIALLNELLRERKSQGKGLLITTHAPELMSGLADRHLRLEKGQIEEGVQ